MEVHNLFTQDGLKLHVVQNFVAQPRAHIFYLHGYTEHSRRHDEVVARLNAAGFSVTRYDHRGFGKSEGERAYVEKFDLYLQDLHTVREKYFQFGMPNFMMGVSMGGLIITKYLMTHGEAGIAGAVLLAPALKLDDDISPFLVKMSGFLGKYLPKLKTVKLEVDALSRVNEVKEDYLSDPLTYKKGAKSRFGLEMLNAIRYVQDNWEKITLPLLLLHGSADRLADPLGSQWMYEGVKSIDKHRILYEGLYHELHFEPEKEQVFQDILSWLNNKDRFLAG